MEIEDEQVREKQHTNCCVCARVRACRACVCVCEREGGGRKKARRMKER